LLKALDFRIRLDTIEFMNYVVVQTEKFAEWHESLRDQRARIAIVRCIRRVETGGNFGDVKPVGDGVSEMRVDIGAGYRVYFTLRERTVVFFLCDGNKKTQAADIKAAHKLATEVEIEYENRTL
jgi:putative addiction module killer protein